MDLDDDMEVLGLEATVAIPPDGSTLEEWDAYTADDPSAAELEGWARRALWAKGSAEPAFTFDESRSLQQALREILYQP
jgi:hypothetical protein